MEIIVLLLIALAIIGIPSYLIFRIFKKFDENKIVYSPEEVTKRLRRGFYLSNWGIDLLFGGILSFIIMFCDVNEVFMFLATIGTLVIGLIVFFVGRMQVGMMTRYINFCNRERTEFEEWILQNMLDIEEAAAIRNVLNSITKVTPGVTDDMISAMNSKDIISGYRSVGKIYTGNNIFKNHWPIISIIGIILISVVTTIVK